MRFQISTDYAIRILQHLHGQNGEMSTAVDISQAIGITYPFFIKIANQLKRESLVNSVQGRYGGYILGKSAHEISIYDVILSIEGELYINRCLSTGQRCEHGQRTNCKVHDVLSNVQSGMVKELSDVTIADLVG